MEGSRGNLVASLGVLALAVIVVGFLGAYALLYPHDDLAKASIGALISIASAAGGYFFHAQQTAFLGQSLQLQRDAFVVALQASGGGTTPTTRNVITGSAPTEPTTPTPPTMGSGGSNPGG